MITFSIIWFICGFIGAFILAKDLHSMEKLQVKDIGPLLVIILIGGLGLWIAVCIVYQEQLEKFGNKKLF